MANQVIPLTTNPNQTMQVPLSVNGGTLRLNLAISYNDMANYWILNISDASGNPILFNIPMITGCWPAANILGQYQYLNIGSAYIINSSNADQNDYPGKIDLGTDFILLWGDNV